MRKGEFHRISVKKIFTLLRKNLTSIKNYLQYNPKSKDIRETISFPLYSFVSNSNKFFNILYQFLIVIIGFKIVIVRFLQLIGAISIWFILNNLA